MLKFLLDEQISPAVGEGLRKNNKTIVVQWVSEWKDGKLLGLPDSDILSEACAHKLTLVTYDLRTIPPLLKTWAEEGRKHQGVIFLDVKTMPSSNFGGLIRALEKLWSEAGTWDWEDRVVLLRR